MARWGATATATAAWDRQVPEFGSSSASCWRSGLSSPLCGFCSVVLLWLTKRICPCILVLQFSSKMHSSSLVVWCSSLAELRTSGSKDPLSSIKSHSPSTHNSSVLIAAYLHSTFLFQLLGCLPFLNMFLFPFFVLFPVWPQREKYKSNPDSAVKMDTFRPHTTCIIKMTCIQWNYNDKIAE